MANKKTVAEKIGRGPDWAAGKIDNIRRQLLQTYPESKLGQTAKVGGYFLLSLFSYMVKTFDIAIVNNVLLRAMEHGYKSLFTSKIKAQRADDKFSDFMQKNPWILSYLTYYMMLSGIVIGANRLMDDARDDSNIAKIEIVNDTDTDKEIIDSAVLSLDAYWVDIAVGLTELETYRATPRKYAGESRYTYGLGTTWIYSYDNNGKLQQTPSDNDTIVRDKDENYEQVRRHLEFDTMPALVRAVKNRKNITDRHAIAMLLAGYQRPSDMVHIAARLDSAKTVQEVADAFTAGKIPSRWRDGTLKRRWVCAAYAAGIITANDLLKMRRDAFSSVDINNIYRNGHFLLGEQTVKYVMTRPSVNGTVEKFLSGFDAGLKILDVVKNRGIVAHTAIKDNLLAKNIEESMSLLNQGNAKILSMDFKGAIELFQQAINIDADNMGAYSELADAYNKLGEQNNDIECFQNAVNVVVKCNSRMNANKSLLMDRDVKAESYYTAGCARRAMGDIYMSRKMPDKARENYRKAAKNFENAVYNYENGDVNDIEKLQMYIKAAKEMTTRGKRLGFNSGLKKLHDDDTIKNAAVVNFMHGDYTA